MEWDKIIQHDVTQRFPLDDNSIDVVITSPPYWGLRDYGVDGQIGLESHPKEYIKHLVGAAREIRRVLKKSGSFYLNLGDTYFGGGGSSGHTEDTMNLGRKTKSYNPTAGHTLKLKRTNWLQPKQLLGIPWRVAIALQEGIQKNLSFQQKKELAKLEYDYYNLFIEVDEYYECTDEEKANNLFDKINKTKSTVGGGWILRNDIIWHKPNPMPSSVRDRLNCTFEHVFQFVKNRRYYYDLDAIRVPHEQSGIERCKHPVSDWKTNEGNASWCQTKENPGRHVIDLNPLGKNPGDVLEYNSKYKKGTHGQTPQGFTRVQSIAKERTQSREDAKRLYPNDPKKQQEYINYIHDHGGDPRGCNPGDVLKTKASELKETMYGEDKGSRSRVRAGLDLSHNNHPLGKNPGDFWNITTQPFTGYNPDLEHFAVFPESLLLKPLKSSCPRYVCKKCGKPRTRIIETKNPSKEYMKPDGLYDASHVQKTSNRQTVASLHRNASPDGKTKGVYYSGKTVDWTDCGCGAGFDAGVVLDPFCGRGTVGKVAKQLGLHYILFDIKPEYCELARLYIGGQKHKLHRDQSKLGVINEI